MVGRRRAIALLLVAAWASACGRFGFDAGGDDVVGPGQVGVSTRSRAPGGAAATGIVVWSNRADGSLADIATSDETGEAVLDVEGGGSVSAAYPGTPGTPTLLRTVFDVAPGDALAFGADNRVCDQTPRGTVTVSWAAVAGATRYDFGSGCNQVGVTAPTTTLQWAVTNDVPDPIDLVVYAIDAAGERSAVATKLAAAAGDGAAITIAPADWFAGPRIPIGFSGIPADLTEGDVQVVFRMPSSPVTAGSDGVFTAPVTGGALQFDAMLPPGVEHLYSVVAVTDAAATHLLSTARRIEAPLPANLVTPIDPLPRRVDTVAYDAAAHRITWADAAAGDADALSASYILYAQGGPLLLKWSAWAPADRQTLAIPALPDGVSIDMPAAGSVAAVTYIAYQDATSWPVLRQRDEWDTPFDNDLDEGHASSYAFTSLGPVTPP